MDLQTRFATEEDCREYLFDCRWPDGFVCPGCGGRNAGQATRRHLWICTACKLQTSVTAGTVMHATRTPLRTWFWAAYLTTSSSTAATDTSASTPSNGNPPKPTPCVPRQGIRMVWRVGSGAVGSSDAALLGSSQDKAEKSISRR